MAARLIEIVQNLPQCRVLLVGDLMLDHYLFGNAERLSPEAPVPVLHFKHEDFRLGGSCGVAANAKTLGAHVDVVGLLGQDASGQKLRGMMEALGCDCSGLVPCARPTTAKVRLVGLAQHRHPQQMIRLDYEDSGPATDVEAADLLKAFHKSLLACDMVLLEDYNKGVLSNATCRSMIDAARAAGKPVMIDPANLSDYAKYRGATCIKLNRNETEKATALPVRDEADFTTAGRKLIETLDLECVVITLDKDGAFLVTSDGQAQWLRTRQRHVYDVTGAGDMVLAMLAVARAAGATWAEAVALANVAGGLEVEKFGAVPITPLEIQQELLREMSTTLGKRRTLNLLLPELERQRAAGKKIVFTNGCFDLIHLGHVEYFRYAKREGDFLVVGVNTDQSIRRLKGDKRPVVSLEDRLGVLEELESIDYLVPFDTDTPLELIQAIQPDVLVKGADYAKEQVVGWDLVEARGGRVALAPLVEGRSTSSVIKRIVAAYSS